MLGSFRFAYPLILAGLLLLPLLAWLSARQARRPRTLRYASLDLVRSKARSWRLDMLPLLRLLRWMAYAMMIIGLARPQRGNVQQVVRGEGVDIALALDISGSMAALDFQPDNRLVAAKQVIEEFISDRTFDRIGLVVFANDAFVQSPLTIDHVVLGRLLDQIFFATSLGLEEGTAVGMGLATAANMLKESDAQSKVVILLTDGVNNAGAIDPLTASQAAAALEIKVYTIGMGRPGLVDIPSTNIFGQQTLTKIESQLDEATLTQIAEETGGLYYRADDTDGLRRVIAEINALETSEIEIETFDRFEELAGYILLPALFLLFLEVWLRQTVFRTLP